MDTNCTRLEDWLADQPHAGAGELPSTWMQHIGECGPCAQRWQDECLLTTAIAAWRTHAPHPPAVEPLITTLLAEVAVKHPASRPVKKVAGRGSWWPMLVASAALVVVGIGLGRSLPTDTTTPWVSTSPSPDATQQLALTSTVGALMSRFEGTSHDLLTSGQNALPRFPAFQQNETTTSPFEAADMIDPQAPAEVLRYGQPLSQGVGQAFQFLQIAVPVPTTDAG